MTIARLDGLVHQYDRAVQNARVFHGVATHPQHEGSLWVLDELCHQVQARDRVVFGRRRKASLYRGGQGLNPKRRNVELDKGLHDCIFKQYYASLLLFFLHDKLGVRERGRIHE